MTRFTFKQCELLNCREMSPEDTDRIASSADPDQTAPRDQTAPQEVILMITHNYGFHRDLTKINLSKYTRYISFGHKINRPMQYTANFMAVKNFRFLLKTLIVGTH